MGGRPTAAELHGMETSSASLGRQLAVTFIVALGAAAVAGTAVGFAVYSMVMASSPPSDEWAELGAAIFGGGAGVLVGAATYVGISVVGIRRAAPRGERARPIVAFLVMPIVLWIGLGAATAVSQPGLAGIPSAVAAIAVSVAVVVGALSLAGAVRLNTAARWGGPAVVLAAVGIAGSIVLAPAAERAALRDELRRIDGLALIDGTTLDEPLPGWQLDSVYADDVDGSVSLDWRLPASYGTHERATLRLGRAPHDACDGCVVVARRRLDGGPVLHDGYRTWTDFSGSRWEIDGYPGLLAVEEGASVLARLEPADAEAFANAASEG